MLPMHLLFLSVLKPRGQVTELWLAFFESPWPLQFGPVQRFFSHRNEPIVFLQTQFGPKTPQVSVFRRHSSSSKAYKNLCTKWEISITIRIQLITINFVCSYDSDIQQIIYLVSGMVLGKGGGELGAFQWPRTSRGLAHYCGSHSKHFW